MGQPAAKKNDQVIGVDIHIAAPGATPAPLPFIGMLNNNLSSDVNIEGMAAATKDSEAKNTTNHISNSAPASNKGRIIQGSGSVFINGKSAARAGDMVETCNDPADAPTSAVVAVSTVFIGG
jgi:uncharacterized Zn-binding protein involved in type VI secretion